ncbi:MAG: 4-hydroxy-tetrahydrodipicolinate reductase [Bacteroidales bacterium]|nr:4-hydroxy-tetrahydrodipicolinate reductase [Bacteroidales bacterium]
MDIALIGYGKMGKTIEQIAVSRGHRIVQTIDIDNLADFVPEKMNGAQVAVEFTGPKTAFANVMKCMDMHLPVVCGSTGWYDRLPEAEARCRQENQSMIVSSNFSLGVNIFFKLNRYLARIMNRFPSYDVSIDETHHTQKLDAPSGTAITLAKAVIGELDRKTGWQLDRADTPDQIRVNAFRRDSVPGIHTVRYTSEIDDIVITHDAHSRAGLALGAVLAAEYIYDKHGVFSMDDVLQID